MIRFILLLLSLSCALTWNLSGAQAQAPLKIVSYNVKHGFESDPAVTARYGEWISKQRPDVVLYQELNDFTKAKLKTLAQSYGHAHSFLMNREAGVDVTHPLGITSRYPIKNPEVFLDSMWHGYLHATVQGIHIFVTHMAPFTLKDRQRDISRIIAHTRRLPADSEILIAGDLNAFARADQGQYDAALLASMRKLEGRLEPKSGTPIVKNRIIYRNNLNNGSLDYSVTDSLVNAGFLDSYRTLHQGFMNSVPTKANQTKSSKLRRIDYIWVSKQLRQRLTGGGIIQDATTDVLSDHYPVFIELKK